MFVSLKHHRFDLIHRTGINDRITTISSPSSPAHSPGFFVPSSQYQTQGDSHHGYRPRSKPRKEAGPDGYSSHQYSVSIRTELTDLSQVEQESSMLYRLLLDAVDQSIHEVGFMPDAHTYGSATNGASPPATNGRSHHHHANGNGHTNGSSTGAWRCSDKQRGLIEKVVREKNIDKREVEQIALEMFGAGVRQLDRLQASGLINELFERYNAGVRRNGKPRNNGNGHPSTETAGSSALYRAASKPVIGGLMS
jgi:hypothetical protein